MNNLEKIKAAKDIGLRNGNKKLLKNLTMNLKDIIKIIESMKEGHKLGEREVCIECIDRIIKKLNETV